MTDVPPGGGWRSQAMIDRLILAALARIEAKLDAKVEETMSQHLARVLLKDDARMVPDPRPPHLRKLMDEDDARRASHPSDLSTTRLRRAMDEEDGA